MNKLLPTSITAIHYSLVKVICTLSFLILSLNYGLTQMVNLPCQTEDVAVEDLERKDFETPSGNTAIHSEGSMHNFTLPLASDFGPCKIISNITITINAIGVDLSNLPPDCAPTPLPYYYNIALGCPDFTPASCNTANLLGEPNTPTFTNQNLSYNGDYDFGENLSVDIVPVMNINCTLGQEALTMNTVVLDYEICVSVTISDAPSTISVDLGPDVSVCPNETTTIDAGFLADIDYLWDPNGETSQTITVGQGTYNVTVTDTNGCTDSDEIIISPFPDSDITFDPVSPTVCDNGQVSVSVNESYSSYMWSNAANTQTVSLSPGSYDVTITDSNLCTSVSSITIDNVAPPNAGIDNFLEVCNDGTTYDIEALLLTFDAGGLWADINGTGVDININPLSVDFENVLPGSYDFTYTVTGTAPCPPDVATISIEVFGQNNAGTSDIVQLCSDPGNLDFNLLLGNPDAGGIWSDLAPLGVDLSNPFSVNFNGIPSGTYSFEYLLIANGPCAQQSEILTVVILEAPFAGDDNAATVCEGTLFNLNDLINGANTTGFFADTDGSGVLTGSSVNTTGLAGQSFNYTFFVGLTGDPCGTDEAIFTLNIESSVSAGDNNTESLCIGGDIDLNDYLLNEDAGGTFVDLDVSGGLNGNILNTNDILAGSYTYQYEIGDGITCPKDSSQIVLTFISRPLIDIAEEEISICESQCQDIVFNLTGTPPFSFPIEIYSPEGILIANDTINTSTNSYNLITCNLNDTIGFANDSLSLLTDSAWILTIPSLMDATCSFTFSNDADTLDIFTFSNAFFNLDTVACITDTLTINGTDFFLGNNSYQDTIPGSRCDSIISIIVNFQDTDTLFINPTICAGDSTMIGSNFYGENNLSDTTTVINPNGCDSITIIAVSFYPQVDSLLIVPLCVGQSTNINGTEYNDTNMSGTDTLFNMSASGCDSIVMVQITPTSGIDIERNDTLCMEGSIVIAGQTFDFNNQTDQIILSGTGCDTTINVALNFHVVEEGNVVGTFCPDYEIEINGNTYDFNNQIGIETILNGSQTGCDSIVNINLMFYPSIEGNLEGPFCFDYNEIVNGTLYDFNNSVGSETLTNASSNGCDSIVNINLMFYPSIEGNIEGPFCSDYKEIVNGILYDINNSVGSETLTNASSNGCDSIVNINLMFYPQAEGFDNVSQCIGDSIFIGGGFQFTDGDYVDTLQSAIGCDSILTTSVIFTPCAFNVVISPTNDLCGNGSGSILVETESPAGEVYGIRLTDENDNAEVIMNQIGPNIGGIFNFLTPGVYTIRIFDTSGMTVFTTMVTIISSNPPITGVWDVTNPISCENGTGSLAFNPSGGQSPYQYLWNDSNIGDTNMGDNLFAGNYSITVTDDLGCTGITNFQLQDGVNQIVGLEIMDPSCETSTDGYIQISGLNSQDGPYNISINDNEADSTYIDGLPIGIYQIIITDANSCQINLTETLESDSILELAQYTETHTITVGDSVVLSGTTTEDSLTYVWPNESSLSCTDCANPIANPITSTVYELNIINSLGCTQTIIIEVIVEEIEQVFEVANIFSPNGDNVNDELVFDYGSEKILAVEIFDRWGNRVFKEELIDGVISWDGIYNGNVLKPGIFVYNIQVTDSEGNTESKFGDVMLLR